MDRKHLAETVSRKDADAEPHGWVYGVSLAVTHNSCLGASEYHVQHCHMEQSCHQKNVITVGQENPPNAFACRLNHATISKHDVLTYLNPYIS